MPTRAIVDANVLFARTQRDWLALLYLNDDTLFSVHWTEDILAQTISRLRRRHLDWSGGRITQVADRVRATFEGGRVDDFVSVGSSYQGTDPNDQHVHDAAIACGAHILLTSDGGFTGPRVDVTSYPTRSAGQTTLSSWSTTPHRKWTAPLQHNNSTIGSSVAAR